MLVVFTDLDGTLLDHDTYSFEPARPALAALRAGGHALVLCSSKTRAEIEALRASMGHDGPFIVENGGAVFIPPAALGGLEELPVRDGYRVLELGAPYAVLCAALHEAAAQTGVRVRAFSRLRDEDVRDLTGLPLEIARLARRREYDEPFLIEDPARADILLSRIETLGWRWTRGGRFHHILGKSDKAEAAARLTALYRRRGAVRTLGLGDGMNDAGFLALMDQAVLVRSRHTEALQSLLPQALVTEDAGPAGWNRAVLEALATVAR